VAVLATIGIILGAAYMLFLYRRIIFGKLTKADLRDLLDLSPREVAVFAPIVVLVLWLGVYPQPVLDIFGPAVEQLVRNHQTALAQGAAQVLASR
jgi:NADH-quinone oxidoreductase subunit M